MPPTRMVRKQTSTGLMARAAEENPREFIGSMLGDGFHASKRADWVISGIPEAFFNPVLRSDFPENASRDIERMKVRYDSSASSMSWWVSPFSRPRSLGEQLLAAGFMLEETVPAMAIRLKDLKRLDCPEGLVVRRVGNRRELTSFFGLWTKVFGISDESRSPLYRTFLQKGRGPDSDVLNFQGFLKGRLVAASTLYLGKNAGGIYNVGTLEFARGKGIGSAMTHFALDEARRRGYAIGPLQSSEPGYGVYRKLGFRELFRVEEYVRPKR